MHVPVDGHPLPLLPALDGGHVAVKVGGDFLPRIQPVLGRSDRWQCTRGSFAHRTLLIDCRESRDSIVTLALGDSKAQHSTANRGTAVMLQIAVCWPPSRCPILPVRCHAATPNRKGRQYA